MKKTKKALASLAIAGMVLSMAPASVFAADENRIAGADRYATSIQIAEKAYASATTAVIAAGNPSNLVDALAAAPLAAQEKAPIYLTDKADMNDNAVASLKKLGVSKVFVVGAAASEAVVKELKAEGLEVVELKGAGRVETAEAINAKLTAPKGTIVVGYNGVADAMSVASYAAANNYAIVVAKADGTIPGTAAADYVIGGPTMVKDIAGAERIFGADRYETNKKVLAELAFDFGTVYVGNGATLADALVASVLAGQTKSPIALSDGKTVAAAATAGSMMTSASKVIALGGTGVVSDAALNSVKYQAPVVDELTVESVTATNLKEVVVTFNNDVDEDEVDAADFDVEGDTPSKVSVDGKVVKLTMAAGDELTNEEEYEITISGIIDVDGNELKDDVELKFTAADYALPVATKIEFTGPQNVKITFSEPLDSGVAGEVSVDDGIYSGSSYSFSGNTVTVDIGTELSEEDHVFKIKGFADYAGYTMASKSLNATYNDVTEAPVVSVKEISQKEVTLKFNRPVKGIEPAAFYQTYSSWQPLEVQDKNGAVISSLDDYYDEVTLIFTDDGKVTPANDDSQDKLIPVGTPKIVVLAETDDAEIKDRWGNTLDADVVLKPSLEADTSAPTVTKLDVKSETVLEITFSEDINQTDAQKESNYAITNADGDKLASYEYTATYSNANDKYVVTITFDEAQDSGDYTIEIKGMKDVSLSENEMTAVTKKFTVTDKTAVDMSKVDVSMIAADKIIYVKYPEVMATTGAGSVLNAENYLFGNAGIAAVDELDEDAKISMFTDKIVKIQLPSDATITSGTADLVIGRVADLDGNYTTDFSTPFENFSEEVGPVVTEVKKVADNKLEIKVDQELKSVTASGVKVDGDGDSDSDEVAAISFVNDGDDTIIKVTLKASEKSTGTAGLAADASVEVVANKIKSVTGAYAVADVYGATGGANTATAVTVKDGAAPEIVENANEDLMAYAYDLKDDDGNAGTNGLIDTIKIQYSEAVKANTVSKYTYQVAGYTVTAASASGSVVTIDLKQDKEAMDNNEIDTDATPAVTQVLNIEDVAGNKFMAEDSVEVISAVDVAGLTDDATDAVADLFADPTKAALAVGVDAADIAAAQKLVDNLVDGAAKTALQADVDAAVVLLP